ncbi:MAG: hypothetical protein QXV17_04975 [Candidatus Micrarchaeaceae archaeon]
MAIGDIFRALIRGYSKKEDKKETPKDVTSINNIPLQELKYFDE